MTTVLGLSTVAGATIVAVSLVAIALLVLAVWRRSGPSSGATMELAPGPRIDTHAVRPMPADPGASPSPPPAATAAAVHHSATGMGAAELAALVEEGLIGLAEDLAHLGHLVREIDGHSNVPDDLPAAPAADQIRFAEAMVAAVDRPLRDAVAMADLVADDVHRADAALDVVHDELRRIGLPPEFFVAMDEAAAASGVACVHLCVAAQRLMRRFAALSALYSTVRPTTALVDDLTRALDQTAIVTSPWRRVDAAVDITQEAVDLLA